MAYLHVRHRGKYHPPKSRKSRPGCLFWLFAIILLAGGIWFWWHHSKPRPKPKPVPQLAPTKPARNPAVTITSTTFPRPARNVLEAQIALTRRGISPGSIDGAIGSQTRAAIRAFQQKDRLPVTGVLDAETKSYLILDTPPFTTYTITSNDLARLQPLSKTWLGKSQQTALDYETILELVAEKSQAHPYLIRQLNPGFDWTNVVVGASVQVPDVTRAEPTEKSGFYRHQSGPKNFGSVRRGNKFARAFPVQYCRKCGKAARGRTSRGRHRAKPELHL